jgi:hypothetical protein
LEAQAVIARIRARIPELAEDLETLQGMAVKHAQDGFALASALFPIDGRDSYRNAALQVASAAMRLNACRWQHPALVKTA